MRVQWQHIRVRDALLLSLLMFLSAGALIHAMGHPLICKCGFFKLWHGGLVDAEVSQHLVDWYTPSHVIHGIVIYGVMWVLMGHKPSLGFGLVVTALFSSVWEILENTSLVVHSFALSTRVADYAGDSVVASIGDMLAAMLGCAAAAYLPIWGSALLLIGLAQLPHDNPWPVAAVFLGLDDF